MLRLFLLCLLFCPPALAQQWPVGNSPDEYGAQIRADYAQWGAIVKRAGIRIE